MLFDLIASFIKAVLVFAVVMSFVPFLIWLERKLVAWMQQRIGPNRTGPFGLLQPIADAVKLIIKENIFPSGVEKITYFLAPMMSMIPALAAFAVIPFGSPVRIMGRTVNLQVADVNIGILYILALSSLAVYGAVLAGWSSNNKYSLLGGLRTSAQMISYELPIGLSVVSIVLLTGSLSLNEVVRSQASHGIWNIFPQFLGFIILLISYNAELNRAPFDLGEAESEIVAGYHTEYSGFRFAMFYMGEYVNMVTVAALVTVLFLGGWQAPFGPEIPLLWFLIKIFAFILLYMWVRATFPRVRYDQLMALGWKILVPASLANLAMTAVIIVLGGPNAVRILSVGSIVLAVLVGLVLKAAVALRTKSAPGLAPPAGAGS
jgi:NADH-quinone oxidoreductase subunit H